MLLGKKDREGNNPRIMVCSKTITFLSKTWTTKFEQVLRNTCSEYKFDKAHNIITVGNVEIFLIADEEPENIYGFDVCCFEENTLISTDRGLVRIKDVKEGDYVLTSKGFRKVKRNIFQGVRECVEVQVDGRKLLCTPDHKFIDIFDNEIEAKDLTKMDSLVKVDERSYRKWLRENGKIERNLKSLISTASDITDILNLNLTESGAISPAQMRIRREVSALCTEICGLLPTGIFLKDIPSITKMETVLTTLSKTLSFLQKVSTLRDIGQCGLKKCRKGPVSQLRKLRSIIRNCLRILNTGNIEAVLQGRLSRDWLSSAGAGYAEGHSLHQSHKRPSALKNAEKKLTELGTSGNISKNRNSESALSAESSSVRTSMLRLRPAHLTAKTSREVGRYAVYDLEVEDCHEYFANGIRVHNCAVLDELDELPTSVAMEAVRSVNDRVRQQVVGFRTPFMCLATTSQGLKGLYQTVLYFRKAGIGFVLMRARTKDNTYLPPDYVKNMYSIYNEKEVECLLEGKFISIDSGLVFPDYNPELNKLDSDLYEAVRDEMKDTTVYIGQDFNGFGNNAIAAVIIDGAVVLVKDYEFPDIRRAPEVFRYDFPTQRIVWIPDMTYKEHFGEFKKELRQFRIHIAYRSCNALVADRNFACNKMMIAERLFICPLCKDTENTLLTWQKDPKTGLPSKGGKGAPDHKGDCLGYIVHYLLSWRTELKDIYQVTLGRLYSKRRDRGAAASELEPTTRIMNADMIRGTLALPDNKENAV